MSHLSLEALCCAVRERHLPVAVHSGKVAPGGVFVVLPASAPADQADSEPGGERYLAAALERGPGYVVCAPRHLDLLESLARPEASLLAVPVDSPRAALGSIARAAFGTDEHCPRVVAITGTNGKTTSAYLLEALFSSLGRKVGLLGTVAYRWPGFQQDAPLTTPDCLSLHDMLARMNQAGVSDVFMEVSSHAIDQQRVAGIDFSGALITNLTQDHLDYHQDMEAYFAVKARLFQPLETGGLPLADKVRAVNADDPFCRRLLSAEALGFGLTAVPGGRRLVGRVDSLTPEGLRLSMEFAGQSWQLSSPLVGSFNAMNLLGVQAMALGLGLSPADFSALSAFSGVPGRLERIANNQGLNVFVDYAHTPDALSNALTALRAAGFARIIAVFGCGGNRDRGKRPLMGQAVARLADLAVLTSDNPRFEDPEAIMADVLPGLAECREVIVQADRRAALARAVELARPGDAVLVAGKGHETYQQIREVKRPFSDQQTLRELLA
ncbi:MAG: UDP-N-acetylmuramoyl-L-alanyl-D-glutamate--2,6-diaminopimelate ligase [Deltaproteobacteria bacterium]|nr:UDP-N-acetylmuramoyl-L-alanyl-D-glutamate--2,6-diaminopimelate ligase [Deltaproteobacteria bacterium]